MALGLSACSRFPLGGCFQPLYGEAAHPGVAADMRAIAVAPIKDRIGHYLGNDLITDLNGTGANPEPKYRLTVTVTTSTGTPTVTSQLQVANAATVTGIATYTLTPAGGGDAIATGTAVRSPSTTARSSFSPICAPSATPR